MFPGGEITSSAATGSVSLALDIPLLGYAPDTGATSTTLVVGSSASSATLNTDSGATSTTFNAGSSPSSVTFNTDNSGSSATLTPDATIPPVTFTTDDSADNIIYT